MKRKLITILLSLSMMLAAIPMTAGAVYGADTTSGLVAHWTFDGNTEESASGIDIVASSGIKYTDGILGQAAVFDGTSSYIESAESDKLKTGSNFSVSMWVWNGDSEGESGTYVQLGKNAGWDYKPDEWFTSPYTLYADWGYEATAYFSNGYNTSAGGGTDGFLNDYGDARMNGHKWQLLTYTYDGRALKIYLDDALAYQYAYSDGVTPHVAYGLMIGANEDLQKVYKGNMDDLRIYNRAITLDDVKGLYAAGYAASKEKLDPAPKMVAYYNFDGNVKDGSTYGNDAKIVEVEGEMDYMSGVKGKSLEFSDGNYVTIPASDLWNLNGKGTISFWGKMNENNNQSQPIIWASNPVYGGNSPNADRSSLQVRTRPWNHDVSLWIGADIHTNDNSYGYKDEDAEAYTAKPTGWHHYSLVFAPATGGKMNIKFYIDGTLAKTFKTDGSSLINTSGDILLGFTGKDNDYFNGRLDELKVYNYPLTAQAIRSQYRAGAALTIASSNVSKLNALKKGTTMTVSKISVKAGSITESVQSSQKAVKFKSSNKKVFTVTTSGKIKAKARGTEKLTITYKGLTKTYTVKVK